MMMMMMMMMIMTLKNIMFNIILRLLGLHKMQSQNSKNAKCNFQKCNPCRQYKINKIVISGEFPFTKRGFKYFVGYQNSDDVTPLCVY